MSLVDENHFVQHLFHIGNQVRGQNHAGLGVIIGNNGGQDIVPGGGANITDDASLRALLEDLAALRVTKCVDWHPSNEAAVFCGFDDPVTLTVSYQTDSGAETSFEMKVGTQNMDGTGRYVRFGEEEAIYLMELELLDPLMRLAYQGMDEPA